MFHSSISYYSLFSNLSYRNRRVGAPFPFKRSFVSLFALMAVIGSSEVYGMEERREARQDNAERPHDSKDENESFPNSSQSLSEVQVETLTKSADKGNTEAQEELVFKLYERRITRSTQFLEWEMIQKKVGVDYLYNLFVLRKCNSEEIMKYFPNLFENIKYKAEEGDLNAQMCLGLMYFKGYGVEGGISFENHKMALKWYTAAAEQGSPDAKSALGDMYLYGKGVEGGKTPASHKIAVKWLTEAAQQGNPTAQIHLGEVYMDLNGQETEAVKWFKAAAEQGYPEAHCQLGLMYLRGRVQGGKSHENDKTAFKYFTTAAEQGYPTAKNNLGNMYVSGRVEGGKSPKNNKIALEWYTAAAKQGYARAQIELGDMYFKGQVEGGVTANNDKIALEWYTAAHNRGSPSAKNNLGLMYFRGRVEGGNSPDNDSTAFNHFTTAAEKGSLAAKNNLGVMYLSGRVEGGKSPDNDKTALKLFKEAANQGFLEAQRKLIALYQTPEFLNLPEAFRWSMASKSNTESPALFKQLCVFYAPLLEQQGSFHDLIEELNEKTSSLLAKHQIQKGLHNPEGSYKESPFAICELHQLYSQLESIELDALQVITSLSKVSPGFMLSGFGTINFPRIGAYNGTTKEIDFLSTFFSSCYIDHSCHVNIGEENVAIAKCFQAYLIKVDTEFAGAEEIINTLLVYHTADLNLAKSKLISCRTRALKKGDNESLKRKRDNESLKGDSESLKRKRNDESLKRDSESLKRKRDDETLKGDSESLKRKRVDESLKRDNESLEKFEKQKAKVAELESDLNPLISAIQQEKATLREIKEDFKALLVRSAGRLNREFFEEFPHLKP